MTGLLLQNSYMQIIGLRALFSDIIYIWMDLRFIVNEIVKFSVKCFDAVGWAAGRASGL